MSNLKQLTQTAYLESQPASNLLSKYSILLIYSVCWRSLFNRLRAPPSWSTNSSSLTMTSKTVTLCDCHSPCFDIGQ